MFSIQAVERTEHCPDGMYKVMVVCETNHNAFHWFRQNSDGTWSQKMGDHAVTNHENMNGTGDIILDPEAAEIGDNITYATPGRYYAVSRSVAYMYTLPED